MRLVSLLAFDAFLHEFADDLADRAEPTLRNQPEIRVLLGAKGKKR